MTTPLKLDRIPVIQHGDLIIDPQCCIVSVGGEEIDLFPKEFDVLYLLAQYPLWVLSARQIYDSVWEADSPDYEHVVSNTIYQIRKKLRRPDIIQTVIEHGYKFIG